MTFAPLTALPFALLVLIISAFIASATAARCGVCNTRYAFCCSSKSADSKGWGWEKVNRKTSCIFPGSQAASDKCGGKFKTVQGGKRCGEYPVCKRGSDDGDGYGWEKVTWDTCIVKGSEAARAQGCSGGQSNPNPAPSGSDTDCNGDFPSSQCPCGVRCGCMVVPGLGRRKQQILKAGAPVSFLASAMMETDHMRVSDYPNGDGKTEGSFCAGLAKQNWFMVRLCGNKSWKKLGEGAYGRMEKLNKSLKFDIQMYKNCRRRLSYYKFFAGHRWGYEGYFGTKDHTRDIKCFIRGYEWTLKRLKGSNLKNDRRYWSDIRSV